MILVNPAGRSGHVEFGYAIGQGRRGYYLLDDPDRWDLMLQFSTKLFTNLEDLIKELHTINIPKPDITAKFTCRDCGSYNIGIVSVKKEHVHTWTDIPYSDPVSMWCSGCDEVVVGG